jgi:hypothetical protein
MARLLAPITPEKGLIPLLRLLSQILILHLHIALPIRSGILFDPDLIGAFDHPRSLVADHTLPTRSTPRTREFECLIYPHRRTLPLARRRRALDVHQCPPDVLLLLRAEAMPVRGDAAHLALDVSGLIPDMRVGVTPRTHLEPALQLRRSLVIGHLILLVLLLLPAGAVVLLPPEIRQHLLGRLPRAFLAELP